MLENGFRNVWYTPNNVFQFLINCYYRVGLYKKNRHGSRLWWYKVHLSNVRLGLVESRYSYFHNVAIALSASKSIQQHNSVEDIAKLSRDALGFFLWRQEA